MHKEAAMRRRTDLTFVDAAVLRLARVYFQAPIGVSVCQTLQIVAFEVLDLLKRFSAAAVAAAHTRRPGMRR